MMKPRRHRPSFCPRAHKLPIAGSRDSHMVTTRSQQNDSSMPKMRGPRKHGKEPPSGHSSKNDHPHGEKKDQPKLVLSPITMIGTNLPCHCRDSSRTRCPTTAHFVAEGPGIKREEEKIRGIKRCRCERGDLNPHEIALTRPST